MLKKFKDLSEKEILAIAISAEDEDGRIYGEFADALSHHLEGRLAVELLGDEPFGLPQAEEL